MNINDYKIGYIWYDAKIGESENWNKAGEPNPFLGMYERKTLEKESYFSFDDIDEIHVYPIDFPDVILSDGTIVESDQFVCIDDYQSSSLYLASKKFFNERSHRIDDCVVLSEREEMLNFFKVIIASMVMK